MRKLIKRMQGGGYAELLSKLGTSVNSGVLQPPKAFTINNPISIPTPSFDSETDNGKTDNGKVPLDFNAMGNLFKTAGSLLPKTENSDTFNTISGGIDTLGSAVGQINPLAGAIIEGAGVGLNAVNSLFGTKTSKFSKNNAIFSVIGGSYSGSNQIADKAAADQNKKFGLFSSGMRKKAENNIQNARAQQNLLGNISETSRDNTALINNQQDRLYNRYNNQAQGGFGTIHVGKKGFKFPNKEEREKLQRIINLPQQKQEEEEDPNLFISPDEYLFSNKSYFHNTIQQGGNFYVDEDQKTHFKPSEYQKQKFTKSDYEQYLQDNNQDIILDYEVPEFKDGGKLNVIPDGALHARLNHMETQGVTKKGIPVITEQEGGVVQHAEVEKNEIIFNKEVTEELEKLHKENSEESAIAAGKLIAQQIMENTNDNTGLLNQIE